MFRPITLESLRRISPSIFTAEGAAGTSDKYQHISTIEVVNGLMSEGFMPVKAMQNRTRKADKALFTKHMLRFRHISSIPTVGGLFPELVLVNSHDGLSSYRLMAGLYRLICSNGLVAGDTFKEVRVRHQGDVVGNVIQGTYEVMKEATQLLEHAEQMGRVELSQPEKEIFADVVHQLRFDGDDTLTKEAIKPEQFLRPRRYQEKGKDDLFTVFNIAQENAIKGGLRGWARDEKGRVKRASTREIKSIDQNNALNRALWTLAERMIQLKGV
ncbi:MAG TPA: DUF932 domain-containing protein [Candidatus Babeliales bacterium]|nr:DUF932 domain-containing protein [Candidatus Babeliales bacterium]